MRAFFLTFTLLAVFTLIPASHAEDLPVPFQEMKEKALAGDIKAQMQLGEAFVTGTGDLKESVSEGIEWLEMAAKQGDANAQFTAGFLRMLSSHELKTDAEKKEAAKIGYAWLFAASTQKHKPATKIVSQLQENMKNATEEDLKIMNPEEFTSLADEYIELYVTPFQNNNKQESAE
ncbi:MAG: hypothetical protein ACRBDL_08505 [Alphaproteobacteria bacterium]